MGTEEFLIGIIIDRRSKGRLREMESKTIDEIGCVVPF